MTDSETRSGDSRVAVVTGAGQGLGAAIALALAVPGRRMILHYRSSTRAARDVAEACRGNGAIATLVQADFADEPAQAAAVVSEAVSRYGTVDILVNNAAATTSTATLVGEDQAGFETVLAVNVVAMFLATQRAARAMIEAGQGGSIVNIGSVHGFASAPGHVAYDASKAAVGGFTRAAAVELGPHRITVNCVAPGAVAVERYERAGVDVAWLASRTAARRLGEPEEIGAVVRFLVSDDARYITGETIVVDGGAMARLPFVR